MLLYVQLKLADVDAETVGIAYFPPYLATKLTPTIVQEACKAEDISFPRKANKGALLRHFGRELVKKKRVRLNKTCNLTRNDINYNL